MKKDIGQTGFMSEEKDDQPAEVARPPIGGLVAWVQVVAAFFIFFNTWSVSE